MRIGCSSLKWHLYLNHCIEEPRCDCGYNYETVQHYFFHCPLYAHHRQILLSSMPEEVQNVDNFLYGSNSMNETENKTLILSVLNYIKKTDRF